jgi:hypothetical protein
MRGARYRSGGRELQISVVSGCFRGWPEARIVHVYEAVELREAAERSAAAASTPGSNDERFAAVLEIERVDQLAA